MAFVQFRSWSAMNVKLNHLKTPSNNPFGLFVMDNLPFNSKPARTEKHEITGLIASKT